MKHAETIGFVLLLTLQLHHLFADDYFYRGYPIGTDPTEAVIWDNEIDGDRSRGENTLEENNAFENDNFNNIEAFPNIEDENERFETAEHETIKRDNIAYLTPQLEAWSALRAISERGKRKPPAMSVDLTLHTLRDMLRSKSGRKLLTRLKASGRGMSRAHLSRAGKR